VKDANLWRPSKYVEVRGRWRANSDTAEVGASSRLMVERNAAAYTVALAEHARGELLDLGCGSVPLYGAYRDYVTNATCVDWASSLHPSIHLDVSADLGEPLPFPDESFDTIVLTDVLEHLPRPDIIWAEAARLLRPGGVFLVGVPFLYWVHEQPFDYHRYTEHRLRLFCADHGFDVVSLTPYGGTTDVVFDALGKILVSKGVTSWLVPWLEVFGERVGRKRARQPTLMPLGYLLVARKAQPS
jgi:SAM-dependent methyltransferase